MTDDRSKALVPQDVASRSPISRLAERTLAERVQRALVVARTLVVGPGGYATISLAVEAAREGDTILVRPGRYLESVVVEGKTITIRGDGERDAIVVGWDKGLAFAMIESRSTLSGITLVGGNPDPESEGAALRVTGGAPLLDGLRVMRGRGIVFEGGAAGKIEHSQIDGNDCGIFVGEGASPRIEENEIWANTLCGIEIADTGTHPLVRANRIHDGHAPGICVHGGASPQIEKNNVWGNDGPGIQIGEAATDPLVTANPNHDDHGPSIGFHDRGEARIEENEIWANAYAGIQIGGAETESLVKANLIHDGKTVGILVCNGASPRIEENEVCSNTAAEIDVYGAGTDPLVRANRLHDGEGSGVVIYDGASPRIEENEVWGNAHPGIEIGGPGTNPLVRDNRVHDGGVLASG